MRKLSCVVLSVFFCCLLLTGCKPSGMSDNVYNWGCAALSATDDYLNGKSTLSATAKAVEDLSDEIMDAYSIESTPDVDLMLSALKLSTELNCAVINAGVGNTLSEDIVDPDAVKEARDALAKDLGK